MKSILVLFLATGFLFVVGCKKSANGLTEGACMMNPSMPSVVLKIKGVGDKLVSFESNVTGSLLSQYDKALLEDELKIGTTVVTSCELFDEAKAK